MLYAATTSKCTCGFIYWTIMNIINKYKYYKYILSLSLTHSLSLSLSPPFSVSLSLSLSLPPPLGWFCSSQHSCIWLRHLWLWKHCRIMYLPHSSPHLIISQHSYQSHIHFNWFFHFDFLFGDQRNWSKLSSLDIAVVLESGLLRNAGSLCWSVRVWFVSVSVSVR